MHIFSVAGFGNIHSKKVFDFKATVVSEVCLYYTFEPDCEAFN